MTITVSGEELQTQGPKQGMLIDYGEIKDAINPIVEQYLDHHYLNETLNIYPTSENIAKWIYDYLQENLVFSIGVDLKSVTIHETCTCSCTYNGE